MKVEAFISNDRQFAILNLKPDRRGFMLELGWHFHPRVAFIFEPPWILELDLLMFRIGIAWNDTDEERFFKEALNDR